MKTLLGIIIGIALTLGLTVYAASNPLNIIQSTTVSGEYDLYKMYDEHNGVVCYIVAREWWLGGSPSLTSSISCVTS